MAPDSPLVAAVDGSQQSVAAASWAATEATLRHAEIQIVLVNDVPERDEELRTMLQGIVEQVAAPHPGVSISQEIIHGNPATELIHRSEQAQVLVMGSRGRGPVASALLGSVSTKAATHAHCAVVVVREPRYEGPVVVGLDESAHGQATLRFAFQAAAERGAELIAVQVWEETPSAVPISEDRLQRYRDRAHLSLTEQLAGWDQHYPEVAVRALTRRGQPVEELTQVAREAQLLVVGQRGSGEFAGLLGSVATGVLHHASGVIAVVRNGNP
jgi:nucleotide-binding universal stress UspA family protein